jgi:hypothetical protein
MEGPEFLLAVITIISVFVAFPAIIINGIVRAKKAKAEAKGGGDALRMSELQLLIEAAVDEATAPLLARIEVLEDERLLAAPPPRQLEMPAEAPPSPAARARQTA